MLLVLLLFLIKREFLILTNAKEVKKDIDQKEDTGSPIKKSSVTFERTKKGSD